MDKYIAEVVGVTVACITLIVMTCVLCSTVEHALAFKQGYQQVQQYGCRGYVWQKRGKAENE